jgi:hypothetical protein
MPLLVTLAIIVLVLVVLVLLYLTFVPIVASFRAAACLIVAELIWGLVGLRVLADPAEGIQRVELRLAGIPIQLPPPKRAAEAPVAAVEEALPEAVRARTIREAVAVLFEGLPDILRLLAAVLRETRVRLRLALVFGTGDAATTGETFGALMALRGAASAQPWFTLEATPVFDGPIFDWHAEGEARIRSPIRVLLPTARLFFRVRKVLKEEEARP